MTGRVILLNGCSSAGKTTLARAIQLLAPGPIHMMSLDEFRDGMAPRYRGMNAKAGEPGARGLNVAPARSPGGASRTELLLGDVGVATLRAMRRAVAAVAGAGLDVVVDDLRLAPDFLGDYLDALADLTALFVGVRCDLATVNAREAGRLGRFPGTAAAHFESVHAGCRYDLAVNTAEATPRECARRVLRLLDDPPSPTAFERLRRGLDERATS